MKTYRLSAIVGEDLYAHWVETLRQLAPHGRTHRISVLVAGMLQHAVQIAWPKGRLRKKAVAGAHPDLLAQMAAAEPGEESPALEKAIVALFKDAGVPHRRTNSRGHGYSIVDHSIQEFVDWFNMPWED